MHRIQVNGDKRVGYSNSTFANETVMVVNSQTSGTDLSSVPLPKPGNTTFPSAISSYAK